MRLQRYRKQKLCGCKDIGNRKFEFVANTQFLCKIFKMLFFYPVLVAGIHTQIFSLECIENVGYQVVLVKTEKYFKSFFFSNCNGIRKAWKFFIKNILENIEFYEKS